MFILITARVSNNLFSTCTCNLPASKPQLSDCSEYSNLLFPLLLDLYDVFKKGGTCLI